MKLLSVGAELLHAKRKTDMTTLLVAFLNFENAPKKQIFQMCRLLFFFFVFVKAYFD
jgi:hypothetical protein